MMRSTTAGMWGGGDSATRSLIALASDAPIPPETSVRAGLVELARRHGLTSILADQVDSPLVRAIYSRDMTRRAVMLTHLQRLLSLLDSEGMRVAVIKGPVVAQAYAVPSHRPFSDVDILVERRDLDRAIEVIRGYESVAEIPERGPKAAKRDVVLADASGIRFNVDLHWDLFSYSQFRGRAEGAMADAWSQAVPQRDNPLGPHWALPPSFVFAFLAAHSVLDHRFRLILFRDFVEISRGDPDWEDIERVARTWGLRCTTYLALWIARGAVGASIPDEVLASLRPSSLSLTYLEAAVPRLDLARFDGHSQHPVNLASVLLNDSPTDRLSLLARAPAAFPQWRKRVAADDEPGGTPRTLIVVSTNRRRGAEVFTERLRDGLTSRGWVVEAVSLWGVDGLPRADTESLTRESARSGRRFERPVLRSLRRKIRRYQPDLVVANGGATLRYALAAGFGTRSRLAYIGIGEPQYWIKSRFSKWANRWMLRRADIVLAVSEKTRRQLVGLEPKIENRSHTMFTGVDPEMLEIPSAGLTGPLRVIMLGSLTPEKDPSLALAAVSKVNGALLRFVGDGPLAHQLAEEAAGLGMANQVEFAGSVEDVRPHLEWAHVLILTSKSEGLPGAILEASAAGLAIVAVDVGGVEEAVIHGESGIVTDRDEIKLAEALYVLDEDREKLAAMGEAGRRHIRENFLIDEVVEHYRSVLRNQKR